MTTGIRTTIIALAILMTIIGGVVCVFLGKATLTEAGAMVGSIGTLCSVVGFHLTPDKSDVK